jgi:hypothetical protein
MVKTTGNAVKTDLDTIVDITSGDTLHEVPKRKIIPIRDLPASKPIRKKIAVSKSSSSNPATRQLHNRTKTYDWPQESAHEHRWKDKYMGCGTERCFVFAILGQVCSFGLGLLTFWIVGSIVLTAFVSIGSFLLTFKYLIPLMELSDRNEIAPLRKIERNRYGMIISMYVMFSTMIIMAEWASFIVVLLALKS